MKTIFLYYLDMLGQNYLKYNRLKTRDDPEESLNLFENLSNEQEKHLAATKRNIQFVLDFIVYTAGNGFELNQDQSDPSQQA